ncbi:TerC/Alx family metal homeostasis membrane protein [Granulicella tundricola]|uniref:Integral membrane protein TerC n=1 Tax=Granulicella tundricola (strain ATCC BAA-1859 / DSM 23138 / MP5ACTX9) TaxID=1198114 RepID=E8X122_GRATM|nr:TerC/Alx family metal homeostasis membrane protein [Granulicella tundricola]ADW67888.1 Integral membrane protein TerC [Granulicella tundricola MP5ACTX9]
MATPLSHWIGFHLALVVLLAGELLFSRVGMARLGETEKLRRQHRNAVVATVMWVAAAFVFAAFVWKTMDGANATQFLAGYALEESLSIDNLFVFLLLFKVFRIEATHQPRVLFWGVLGAIVMRGAFIAAGIGLLTRFHWISYVFAVLLLVASVRLVMPEKEEDADKPPAWIGWVSRLHPVSMTQKSFFVRENGRRMMTMLFLALIAIEFSDVVFALDSIPAVLSITRHPFIAYTSNILAVMGLRSLFFLLAKALKQLRYLHYGLAAVLAFAAVKMLAAEWYEVGPLVSLGVIVGILALTIAVSLIHKKPEVV